MQKITRIFIGTIVLAGVAAVAYAQGATDAQDKPINPGVTVNDPPGPMPDPSHVIITNPTWKDHVNGAKGDLQSVKLFGDIKKPGPYGLLLRFAAGTYSPPHTHPDNRIGCVLSGTWWVSTSLTYDLKTTYPVPAGSCAEDLANQNHWDGARAGGPPLVLYVVGEGTATGQGGQ